MRNRFMSKWMAGILGAATICMGLFTTLGFAADGHAADKQETNATVAFNKIKTLAGNWEATSHMGKVDSSFEVIANGSAVVEHLKMAGKDEMMTVYHLDNDRLVLTHYCHAGNQPHMQAEAYDPTSNQLVFDFAGGGSLANANAGHMHNVVLKFGSASEFATNWAFVENGQQKFVENLQYHRVK